MTARALQQAHVTVPNSKIYFLKQAAMTYLTCTQCSSLHSMTHSFEARHCITVTRLTALQDVKSFLRDALADLKHELK